MTFEKSDQMMPTVLWRHCLERLKNHTLKKVIPTRTNKSFFFFLVKQKKNVCSTKKKNACRKIGRVGSVFFFCFFTLKTIGLRFAYQELLFDLFFEGCTAHLLQLLFKVVYNYPCVYVHDWDVFPYFFMTWT